MLTDFNENHPHHKCYSLAPQEFKDLLPLEEENFEMTMCEGEIPGDVTLEVVADFYLREKKASMMLVVISNGTLIRVIKPQPNFKVNVAYVIDA